MIGANSTIADLALPQDAPPVVHDGETKGSLFSKAIGYTAAAVAGSVLLGAGSYFVWRYFANWKEKKQETSPV